MERIVFDVANASMESFVELMGKVDGFYANHGIVKYREVPLTVKKPGWLIIELEFGEESLDLAIDPKDGYLSAFGERGNREEYPWFCFQDCRTDGLSGKKKKLSVESGYGSLVKEDWEGIVAGIPALRDCCYRISAFLRAHRNAAVPQEGIALTTEEKRALARLIFMICEPPRMRSIRIFASSAMSSWSDKVVPAELRTKVNGWSKISRFALHCLGLAIRNKEDEYIADDIGLKELKAVESFWDQNSGGCCRS